MKILILKSLTTHDKRIDFSKQENLDTIQTCIQQLKILESQGVDIEKELEKHNNKLTDDRNGVIEEVLEIGVNVYEKGNYGENKAILNGDVKHNENNRPSKSNYKG